MDLDFTPEEQAFRTNVRGFLEAKVPSGTRSKILAGARASNEEVVRWHRILHEHGWGAPNWPKEVGGTGWGVAEQYIFEEESAAAGAPALSPFGLKMVGPV